MRYDNDVDGIRRRMIGAADTIRQQEAVLTAVTLKQIWMRDSEQGHAGQREMGVRSGKGLVARLAICVVADRRLYETQARAGTVEEMIDRHDGQIGYQSKARQPRPQASADIRQRHSVGWLRCV